MSDVSDLSTASNIYDENFNEETTCDLSSQNLEAIPNIINNKLISVLYLQNNKLMTLPEDFFPTLPNLMWLDLRDNQLTEIPKTIQNHPSLTHLLLQNNNISSLPNEIGTVVNLKVLQLKGNPLSYPPKEIIDAGTAKILTFLNARYLENILVNSTSDLSEDNFSGIDNYNELLPEVRSYNSVLDNKTPKSKPLCVQFNERENPIIDSDEEYYTKIKGKCPKLAKCRHKTLPPYCQSFKYLKAQRADDSFTQTEKIRQGYLKQTALKKHKQILAATEKILQNRKNMEMIREWRKKYKYGQLTNKNSTYKLDPKLIPFDMNPEYMTFLNREDIEKDLPDKYRKKLVRRSKPTVPRKSNNDVHLALKIKQLFENLESIDLNREGMTPRTEQRVLLNEIQKISEIKQKLQELSTSNAKSVATD